MRVIKFRAIDIKTNKFVYGCLVNNMFTYSELSEVATGTKVCEIITGNYESDNWQDAIEEDSNLIGVVFNTVGQFTGLLDKNGVEIYEGDVIQFSERRHDRDLNGLITYKSVVVYEFDCFCVSSSQENNQGLYCVNNECEVIGNIH